MNYAQQLAYESSAAVAWWSSLAASERWALATKYPNLLTPQIFRAAGHHVDPFPHCFYDPPSLCRCARCEPVLISGIS